MTILASQQPSGFFVPQRFQTDPPGVLVRAVSIKERAIVSLDRGRDPIDDQVVIALTRVRGSGVAVAEIGHRFLDIENVGSETSAAEIEAEARFCLRFLVQRNDISLRVVTVTEFPEIQSAEVQIVYTNLRTTDPNKFRKVLVSVRRPEAVAFPV